MGVRNRYLRDVDDERQVLKLRRLVIDVSDEDPHGLNDLKATNILLLSLSLLLFLVVVVAAAVAVIVVAVAVAGAVALAVSVVVVVLCYKEGVS